MKEEKNTAEKTESKTIGKVFLGKRKNGPGDDNYLNVCFGSGIAEKSTG